MNSCPKYNVFFFFQWSSYLSDPEYYRTCVMYIHQQGGMWLKTLHKNVIYTANPMMWISIYTWVNSTLNASSVGTLINTAGKLFHVRIAEGKYEFWWLCILENGIWNIWSWPLVVLVVAGERYLTYMLYSLMGKMRLPFVNSDLVYRGAL